MQLLQHTSLYIPVDCSVVVHDRQVVFITVIYHIMVVVLLVAAVVVVGVVANHTIFQFQLKTILF